MAYIVTGPAPVARRWLRRLTTAIGMCSRRGVQSPCDLVAVKLRGVARAEIMLLEVRCVGQIQSARGLTAAQKRSASCSSFIMTAGRPHPDWSKTVTRKDRPARAKARRDDDPGE